MENRREGGCPSNQLWRTAGLDGAATMAVQQSAPRTATHPSRINRVIAHPRATTCLSSKPGNIAP